MARVPLENCALCRDGTCWVSRALAADVWLPRTPESLRAVFGVDLSAIGVRDAWFSHAFTLEWRYRGRHLS